MNYDMILPAIAGASGVFAGCAVLYSKIRPRFRVTVNCWFCNKDTKVEFRYQESWMCPSCQQYNGFTEDGDYNRDLPAQYCESLNTPPHGQGGGGRSRTTNSSQHHGLAIGNGLCHTCNLNQTLKVRALAEYTPIRQHNYDKEIEEYRKRLERTYGLCRECEATLHQTIGKQDSWIKPKLISWRLQQTSENKAKFTAQLSKVNQVRTPLFLHLLHLTGLLLSLTLFLANLHHLQLDSGVRVLSLDLGVGLEKYLVDLYKFSSILVVTGLSMLLMGIFSSGKNLLLVSDAVASFVWVGLLALCSSKQLVPPSDYNSLQVLLSGVTMVFTLWVSLVPRSLSTPLTIRPHLNKSVTMSEASSDNFDDSQCTMNASFSSQLSASTHRPSSPLPPRSPNPTPPLLEDDLDATLGSLKISSPIKKENRSCHGTPFTPRSFLTERSGCKLNGSFNNHRSVVTPSRLSPKNITQSSWVAGGYWGHPVSPQRDIPTFGSMHPSQQSTLYPLSRSSSQSSGFVSLSSRNEPRSQPGSRVGSHCGDLDRTSVLSEPVNKPWNYASSLYPSDSASQCSYSRYRGQSNGGAQSLHSAGCDASFYSDRSLKQSSPSNGLYQYPNTNGDIVDNSGNSIISTITSGRDNTYKSPWFPFFLGMSIAANGFLIVMLLVHIDIQGFISKIQI